MAAGEGEFESTFPSGRSALRQRQALGNQSQDNPVWRYVPRTVGESASGLRGGQLSQCTVRAQFPRGGTFAPL